MAMDQMIQNRNMPQIGTQNIFDPTTGRFVKVEYQTDPNFPGRRTVMTRTGPQALPGFQGQENPYRALGRGVRNLLGNLFDRGSLRREERKAQKQVMEQADPMLDTMYPSVVERPEFEPVPDNQARIDELQERINRPIVTSQNLPTFDVSQVRTPSTSEFNRKTTSFADGSALLIDTKGNAQLLTKDGSVISNSSPDYATKLKEAIASGVLYESTVARARAEGKENVSQMGQAAEKIDAANANILVLDEALAALDSGAGTGPISSLLPTIRSSSLRLREAQRKLGLNIVSETTFGALSEGELRLALETGLDLSLPEDQLREVIAKRKAAQEKLIDYFYEALDFLNSSETNTIAKFKLKKKQEQKAREKAQQNGGATAPSSSDEDEEYEIRTPEGEILR
tara:strand:+ start:568 stop:1761 length:1194 start_codon:yes stop_codon:yes gene_type:complete